MALLRDCWTGTPPARRVERYYRCPRTCCACPRPAHPSRCSSAATRAPRSVARARRRRLARPAVAAGARHRRARTRPPVMREAAAARRARPGAPHRSCSASSRRPGAARGRAGAARARRGRGRRDHRRRRLGRGDPDASTRPARGARRDVEPGAARGQDRGRHGRRQRHRRGDRAPLRGGGRARRGARPAAPAPAPLPDGWSASRSTSATTRSVARRGAAGSLDGIDVLVAAAGIVPACGAAPTGSTRRVGRGPPRSTPRASPRRSRTRSPHLRDGAAVVAIASLNSWRGDANIPAYVASKHAVLGIVRSAALELGRRGIRVNAIAPGPIATEALLARMAAPRADERGLAGRAGARGAAARDRARADRDRRRGRAASRCSSPATSPPA